MANRMSLGALAAIWTGAAEALKEASHKALGEAAMLVARDACGDLSDRSQHVGEADADALQGLAASLDTAVGERAVIGVRHDAHPAAASCAIGLEFGHGTDLPAPFLATAASRRAAEIVDAVLKHCAVALGGAHGR